VKKVLVIAILLSYSVASFGVSLNYFYCCGKLKTVSLVVKTESKDCPGKSKKGCCDNKTVTIKLKTDQKENNLSIYHFAKKSSPVIFYTDHFSPLNPVFICSINPLYKRPPPDKLLSRQILYSVFRL
jgi:hypothetical protein